MKTLGYFTAFLGGALAGAALGLLMARRRVQTHARRSPTLSMTSARSTTSVCHARRCATWLTISKRQQQTSQNKEEGNVFQR